MSVFGGPSIVTSGLVLELDAANPKSYPGSGTTWTDLSEKQNNISIGRLGTVTYDTTNTKSFLCASGFNGKITTAGDTLDLQSQLTFSAWIKPTGTAFTTGSFYYIFGKNSASGYGDHQYALNIGSTQNLEFQLSGSTISTPATWLTDIWYHVTGTWNGSVISTYINGVLQGSVAATSTTFKPNFAISGRSVAADFSSAVFPFPGFISLTSIYNRALSNEEILQNFNAQRGRYGL